MIRKIFSFCKISLSAFFVLIFSFTTASYVQAALIHGIDTTNALYAIKVNTAGQIILALLTGEDTINSVIRTEQQFSYCVDVADKICKSQPGFIHSISCFGIDASATAGRVRLVDDATVTGTAANELWGAEFSAAIQPPIGAILDIATIRGIHLDFTTTADVKCIVSFR